MPRLDQLLDLLKEDPNDAFLRYGVAMEYAKAGRHEEALAAFNELLKRDPNYVAGYFMAGRTCEQKGDLEAAKVFYKSGIATAEKIGDTHAAGEISSALMAIE
jgi:tetratricopeptide (TPR) repeat protein